MITPNKPKSPVSKVDLNAEDMRLLLTKQKEAWLANGIPDYATRIDRMDRLIALLVGNKDEIAATRQKSKGRAPRWGNFEPPRKSPKKSAVSAKTLGGNLFSVLLK